MGLLNLRVLGMDALMVLLHRTEPLVAGDAESGPMQGVFACSWLWRSIGNGNNAHAVQPRTAAWLAVCKAYLELGLGVELLHAGPQLCVAAEH